MAETPPDRAENDYAHARGQIEHEDNLVTQRLNWFLTSQSFLFTAYAITFNGPPAQTVRNLAVRRALLCVIPVVAIVAGVLILVAIIGGALAMREIRRSYSLSRPLPSLQGQPRTRIMGMLAPMLIPPLFVVVWAILLVLPAT